MKKARRKLVPAIALLLVSVLMVSTTTYAWFSINKSVSVKGMTVKAQVDSNLMIAQDTLVEQAVPEEATFTTAYTQTEDPEYPHILYPVSTVDGVDFYYTPEQKATNDGKAFNAASATYALYNTSEDATSTPTNLEAFRAAYGQTNPKTNTSVFGYKDYVFTLKANNTSTKAQYISMDQLDLAYTGGGDGSVAGKMDKTTAYRVAIAYKELTAPTSTENAIVAADFKAIMTPKDAANHGGTDVNALEITREKAVNGINNDSLAAVAKAKDIANEAATDAAPGMKVAPNSTVYYKVVVRLYMEGEDTTCKNSSYVDLTDPWELNLHFTLVDENDGSSPITGALKNLRTFTKATIKGTPIYYDGTNTFAVQTYGDSSYNITSNVKAGSDAVGNVGPANDPTDVKATYQEIRTAFGITG